MTTPTFASLGVPAPIAAALEADGKTEAFPIQRDTLPDTLKGRDVLGRGRTGSGKTIAFAIPLVTSLAPDVVAKRKPNRPRGVVLAPTRELVTQLAETISLVAEPMGVRVTTIFGGVSQKRQEDALRRGVDIVVAAPGRLDDLMKQGVIDLGGIEVTVLDEADHMADMGFLPVVTRILNKTPKKGQRLLFSATLDNGVDNIVKKYLNNPVTHSVDSVESPVAQMTHHVFEVRDKDAKDALIETLASGTGRRILFTRMKHQAKRISKQLTNKGIPAVELQGNLSQNARERNLAEFSSGEAKVLVATDVAARGIHVDNVELVVHIDPPVEHKAYLHRSGRTARAGSQGDVVTICLPEQRGEMRQLIRAAKIKVTPQPASPDNPDVIDLIGEVAPKIDSKVTERKRTQAQTDQQRTAGGQPAGSGQRKKSQKARNNSAGGEGGARKRSRGGRGATATQNTGHTPRSAQPQHRKRSDSAAGAATYSTSSSRPTRATSGSRRAQRPSNV